MPERSHRPPRPRLARLVLLAWLVVLVAAPLLALLERSTAGWSTTEPGLVRDMVLLERERFRVQHEWETARRPEVRFDHDAELRILDARLRELERRTVAAVPVRGLANWPSLAGPRGVTVAVGAVRALAVAVATTALALVLVLAAAGLPRRPRRLALAALALPAFLPLWPRSHGLAAILAAVGIDGDAAVALAEIAVLLPVAALPLVFAVAARDPAARAAARDLGAGRLRARLVADGPHLALGLAAALAVVFALAYGELALPQAILGSIDAGDFAGLVRRRAVASADLAGAAPWTLAAAAIAVLLALPTAALARRPRHHRTERPLSLQSDEGPSRNRNLRALPFVLYLTLFALPLLTTTLAGSSIAFADAWKGFAGLGISPSSPGDRLLAVLGTTALAAVTAALATALALAARLALGPTPSVALRFALLIPLVLPVPTLALAADALTGDLAPALAPLLARLAPAAAAALAVALALPATDHGGALRRAADLGAGPLDRLRPLAGPAAATAWALPALTAFAVATAGGAVDAYDRAAERSALMVPAAPGLPDPATALALAIAALAAWTLARALDAAAWPPTGIDG